MDAKVFGQFLAQTRKEKNMTQAELAEKISVTDKAVSRWERGLGFPDISTIEPLAAALDLSIPELMRSEKEEMWQKKETYTGQELAELMNQAVEMDQINRRQDKTAAWLAGSIIIGMTAILWFAGKANLLGGAFVGAILALAVVGMYLYAKNQSDKEGRRIYAAFMLGGVGGSISLLNLVGVPSRILVWMMYMLLTLFVVWTNQNNRKMP